MALDFNDVLKEFGEGRTKLAVRFDPLDAFNKASRLPGMIGKFKTHRDYIEYLFKEEHNMKVIQHEHQYDHERTEPKIKKCGLIFAKTDSVIKEMIEVWGIVGVSIVPYEE